MRKLLLVFLGFLFSITIQAQERNFWSLQTGSGKIVTDKAVARQSFPREFKLFNLNIAPLRQDLLSVADNASAHSTIISLPNADGGFEQFEVFEASNFEPALQAQFPGDQGLFR